MPKCTRCGKPAVTYIRYNGDHLCESHVMRFVEDRVKREIRKQCDIGGDERIAIGVSGGKDSCVALWLLHGIFSKRKNLSLVAITVDEGIGGYRAESIRKAEALCEKLGVEHRVVRLENELGHTTDSVYRKRIKKSGKKKDFAPCTYCGVMRRSVLNRAARGLGATRLATGLNLDDTAQSVVMNIFRGDTDRLARMGPHSHVQKGLVPRIQPLRTIPEKEVYLYAMLAGIDFDHSTCPYAKYAARNRYREILMELEEATPGTRHAILKSAERISGLIAGSGIVPALSRCKSCGEPTGDEFCKACILLGKKGES